MDKADWWESDSTLNWVPTVCGALAKASGGVGAWEGEQQGTCCCQGSGKGHSESVKGTEQRRAAGVAWVSLSGPPGTASLTKRKASWSVTHRAVDAFIQHFQEPVS